jgi:RNA polymerase sigma-70 factor (ECF subfamily)
MTLPFLFGGPPAEDVGGAGRHLTLVERATRSEESDDMLLARAKSGSDEAFDALYLRYRAKLWAFAWHTVRASDVAEDVVQDVFVSLWERIRDVRMHHGVKVWLYGAIRNRAIDVLRRQNRAKHRLSAASEVLGMAAPIESPSAQLERAELARAIDVAVDALPERRRLMAVLRWREEMTLAEIAVIVGISVAGVHKGLAEVERALHPLIDAYYRESP